jgi:probable rRNA maturation factor
LRPVLRLLNRQSRRRLDLRRLRRLALWVLQSQLGAGRIELCFHFVDAAEITRWNETYLRHRGPTDVITFDHQELVDAEPVLPAAPPALTSPKTGPHPAPDGCSPFHGEIFTSIDAAVSQAKRYRVSWQRELARYVIHGLLHLAGYDDLRAPARRLMKVQEDRLLRRAMKRLTRARLGA